MPRSRPTSPARPPRKACHSPSSSTISSSVTSRSSRPGSSRASVAQYNTFVITIARFSACSARGAIARMAVFSELARRTLAAARPPLVALALAEIAGVSLLDDDIDERLAAELLGQGEGRGLVDPHERRLQHEAPVHAQAERDLQRLDGVVAAVRVAGEIGLAHTAHQSAYAPAVGERRGGGEKKQISPGDEGVGESGVAHFDLDVVRHGGRAERGDDAEIEHVVFAEFFSPRGKTLAQLGEDHRAALELDRVALAVVEAHRLDAREIRERPGEAGGRILPARKKHERAFTHGGRSSKLERRRTF